MELDYVISTWQSERTLDRCLQSIEKYGNPNRIIIIDKGSTDETRFIADSYGCEVYHEPGPLGAARYYGFRLANTQYVATVDSDVELTEGWRNVLKYIENWPKACGVVGGFIVDMILWGKTPPFKIFKGAGFAGCCIIPKDLYLRCTRVKEFSAAEDTCFAEFIYDLGFYWLVENAPAYHHQIQVPISKTAWYGSGARRIYGFKLNMVKKVIGGAVLGINQRNPNDTYLQNWAVRLYYMAGYLFPEKYFEYDRRKE